MVKAKALLPGAAPMETTMTSDKKREPRRLPSAEERRNTKGTVRKTPEARLVSHEAIRQALQELDSPRSRKN